MARGWESKGIESQIEDRQAREAAPAGAAHTAEDLERVRQRESLESSLRGIRRELDAARSPVHRAALENAIHHLEDQLRKLG